MDKQEFIQRLKRERLTKQQRSTLRGQAIAGNLEAAIKGLETIKKRRTAHG